VTSALSIGIRMAQAASLDETLEVAYEAFQQVLTVIHTYEDSGGSFYGALIMAAAAAANGRDIIAAAPSLPAASHPARLGAVLPVAAGSAETAAHVAAISAAVASGLIRAAGIATEPADREACTEAVDCAREIHGLATGHD